MSSEENAANESVEADDSKMTSPEVTTEQAQSTPEVTSSDPVTNDPSSPRLGGFIFSFFFFKIRPNGRKDDMNGHKGGLLQLSSLGYFRTTVTTAAVCLQRRRSSRVLGEEVGAHNSTPP